MEPAPAVEGERFHPERHSAAAADAHRADRRDGGRFRMGPAAERQASGEPAAGGASSPRVRWCCPFMSGPWAPLVVLALLASAGGDAVGVKVHHKHGRFAAGPWKPAHATFYGGRDGSDTRVGACGYKDTVAEGYGVQTAAVSTAMFNGGETLRGVLRGAVHGQPGLAQGRHSPFDGDGDEHGGIRYTITGNKYFNMVAVTNVGGAGDVAALKVKGNKRVDAAAAQLGPGVADFRGLHRGRATSSAHAPIATKRIQSNTGCYFPILLLTAAPICSAAHCFFADAGSPPRQSSRQATRLPRRLRWLRGSFGLALPWAATSTFSVVSTPEMEDESYRLRTTALQLTAAGPCSGITAVMMAEAVEHDQGFPRRDI
ncbi:hypothetical protein ZWY2020_028894 [Hordeum vulgare]|nr:hypothetical protein ZWY2020_028894 [Hordeum vulgare]